MCKLQPKISGRFQTMKGAMIFSILRSILNTARKRGLNVIDILDGSLKRVVEALDYTEEVLDAFENCLKGEGMEARGVGLRRREGRSRQAVLNIVAVTHAFR